MRLLTLVGLLLLCFQANAQEFNQLDFTSSAQEIKINLARDSFDHTIVAGAFGDTLLIKPKDSKKVHKAGARLNAFISKFDKKGNVLWTQSFLGERLSEIYDVETDAQGNIYAAGQFFHGKFDIDPGPKEQILEPKGGGGCFVIKLDPNGNLKWSKLFYIGLEKIALDQDGNIFIGGFYYDQVDLDPSEDEFIVSTPKQSDGIVIKLNKNGDFQWGKRVEKKVRDEVNFIEINQKGEIVIGGLINFDPYGPPGLKQFYISKLSNSDGKSIWYKTISSNKLAELKSLALSPNDEILITGEFEQKITFGQTEFNARGYADAFLYKINSDGTLVWSKQLGDEFQDEGNNLIVNKEGQIHWSGVLGHRAYLDKKQLYYDASFYYILKPNGDLFRNYVVSSSASDYGYRFYEGGNGLIYKMKRTYFNKWTLTKWFSY